MDIRAVIMLVDKLMNKTTSASGNFSSLHSNPLTLRNAGIRNLRRENRRKFGW
jgi:hypothetical protein